MKTGKSRLDVTVFVYGSLLFDEVVECLTGRLFAWEEAILADHRRYAITQENRIAKGPAIISEPGQIVKGRVLLNVDPDTLRILDQFELGGTKPSRYERVSVNVTLGSSDKAISAEAYRAVTEMRPFLSGDWSEQDFKARHLDFYVKEWIPSLRLQWGIH